MDGLLAYKISLGVNEKLRKIADALNNYVHNVDLNIIVNKLLFERWFLMKQSKSTAMKTIGHLRGTPNRTVTLRPGKMGIVPRLYVDAN